MWQLMKASLTKTAFSIRLRSLLVLQVPDCFKVDGIASRTVRESRFSRRRVSSGGLDCVELDVRRIIAAHPDAHDLEA